MTRSIRTLISMALAALALAATLAADAAWKWTGSFSDKAVSMLVIGDIDIQRRADPTTAFSHIGTTLKNADLVYANLEGMLVKPQGPEVDIPDKRGWTAPGARGRARPEGLQREGRRCCQQRRLRQKQHPRRR